MGAQCYRPPSVMGSQGGRRGWSLHLHDEISAAGLPFHEGDNVLRIFL